MRGPHPRPINRTGMSHLSTSPGASEVRNSYRGAILEPQVLAHFTNCPHLVSLSRLSQQSPETDG